MIRGMRRGSMLAVALAGASLVFIGAAPAAAAPDHPRAEGRCVDQTGVLGRALCARVTKILLRDEAATADEIAVAVVPSTGDAGIEEWSTGLFNTWGVGKKDRNNGVLLVVALDDRRVRLETGRGMARRLPDDAAGDIVGTVITPAFGRRAYAAGILAGLDEVRRRIGHAVPRHARLTALAASAPTPEPEPEPESEPEPERMQTSTDDEPVYPGAGDVVAGGGTGFPAIDDGPPAWMVLPFLGVGLLVLIGVVCAAAGSGGGAGGGSTWTAGPGRRHSTWIAGSSRTDHSSWSSGGSASSSGGSDSSSGSSFGGGSSDGGGSSGSW
jgi:uncharacterized protein